MNSYFETVGVIAIPKVCRIDEVRTKEMHLAGEQVLKQLHRIGSRFVAIAVAGGTGERRGPVFENRDIRATTLAPQHQMMTLGR